MTRALVFVCSLTLAAPAIAEQHWMAKDFETKPCPAIMEIIDYDDTEQEIESPEDLETTMTNLALHAMAFGYLIGYDAAFGPLQGDHETVLMRFRSLCEASPTTTGLGLLKYMAKSSAAPASGASAAAPPTEATEPELYRKQAGGSRRVQVGSPRPQIPASGDLKITRVEYSGRYATIVVQGTKPKTPIQCAIRRGFGGDFIATQVWSNPDALVTEVIVSIPENMNTTSFQAVCFPVE